MRHQFVQRHAALQQRNPVRRVAAVHGHHVVGRQRIGQHAHVDALRAFAHQPARALLAGHEVRRDHPQLALRQAHRPAQPVDQPLRLPFALSFGSGIRVHAHLIQPVKRVSTHQRRQSRAASQARDIVGGARGTIAGVAMRTQSRQRALFRPGQRGERNDRGAVPEVVEDRRRLPDRRAHQHRVQVEEVGLRGGIEILVAHVASAHHRHPAVGDPGLVVHATVHRHRAQQHFAGPPQHAGAAARGIEQAHFDIGVGIQRGQVRILAVRGHVVQQQAHAHAAVGRAQHLVAQQVAGEVVVPDVVLQVQAAPRGACAGGTHGEGVQVVGQQRHAAAPGMRAQQGRDGAVERGGIGRGRQRMRGRPPCRLGEASVAVQRRRRRHRHQHHRNAQPAQPLAHGLPFFTDLALS